MTTFVADSAERSSVVAIDIGGTSTKLALVTAGGDVRDWRAFPTAGPVETYLERLVDHARAVIADCKEPIAGIGGGVAGFLNAQGALLYNPNLAWLESVSLREHLEAATGLPVRLEADSNTACAGEYLFGGAGQTPRFLCITGGTGVGVGMIAHGAFLRPAFQCMGDAGHVIVSPGGPRCSCGGHGCAEIMLSTVELGRHYAALMDTPASFRTLVEALHRDEPGALSLAREAGHALGVLTASLANIFFPDRIAIAGGLSHMGHVLIDSARQSFKRHGSELATRRAVLVPSVTGAHATLLGAAACFFMEEVPLEATPAVCI